MTSKAWQAGGSLRNPRTGNTPVTAAGQCAWRLWTESKKGGHSEALDADPGQRRVARGGAAVESTMEDR